jgi:hypothetical protein
MKRKKTRNSLNSEQLQQLSLSQTKSIVVIGTYLPDECWECVVRFLNNGEQPQRQLLKVFLCHFKAVPLNYQPSLILNSYLEPNPPLPWSTLQ